MAAVIGGDHITIDYYAPSVHGRKIMGNLVPYGEVWCTGANWATKITTESDLDINGLKVPKGSYSIWTLPGEKQWMLIINKETGQFHLNYDESKDFARVKMNLKTLSVAGRDIQDRARAGERQQRNAIAVMGEHGRVGSDYGVAVIKFGVASLLAVVRSVGALRQVIGHHLLAVDAQHASRDRQILLELFLFGREQLLGSPKINARG